MLIPDPKNRNKGAIEQKKHFSISENVLSDIGQIAKNEPYFGWVKLGHRDLYMFLNGNDDGVALRWFWMNTFESTSVYVWEKLSKIFASIIDIGAHTGCYSLLASKSNPKAKVLSIEPLPVNLSRFSMNRAYNMLENILIIPGAAYSSNVPLSMNNKLSFDYCVSGGRVHEFNNGKSLPSLDTSSVQGFKLNNAPDDFSRKSLIKVDTEGSEGEVVLGASDFLASRSWFLCESTDSGSSATLDEQFGAQNYTFFLLDDENGLISKTNSLSPVFVGGKLCMHKLNRLIVPSEDLSCLSSVLKG